MLQLNSLYVSMTDDVKNAILLMLPGRNRGLFPLSELDRVFNFCRGSVTLLPHTRYWSALSLHRETKFFLVPERQMDYGPITMMELGLPVAVDLVSMKKRCISYLLVSHF